MVDFSNISLMAQNGDNLGVVGKYSAVFNCPKKQIILISGPESHRNHELHI